MAIAGRAVQFDLNTFEIMMYRSFVGIVIVLGVAQLAGTLHEVRFTKFKTHVVRNLFHFSGQNLWFYAITVAPLAQVVALEFTSPLWVALLAPLLLGERLTLTRGLSVIIGFLGILIVAKPSGEMNIGILAAALAAVGFAGSIIFTKRLTRTESITCILFFLTTLQALFGVIASVVFGPVQLPTIATAPWLFLIGCAGLMAHFCLTTALSYAPAVIVIPFDFVRLPLIAVIGALLYGEPLEVSLLIGGLVILGANYLNIWGERPR